MLIARAPLRISLGGGGTDLPAYYQSFGGCVVSTSINKYVYVVLSVSRDHHLQISSSDYGIFYRHGGDGPPAWEGDLRLPRAILHDFNVSRGVSAFIASEVPPGTGLGSSSAVAVATIKAVGTACGIRMSTRQIAEMACDIEINKLRNPMGKQDQYAAAFGGLNVIEFSAAGTKVTPLPVRTEVRRKLDECLLLFYTGAARDSGVILRQQEAASARMDERVLAALDTVKQVAHEIAACLLRGDVESVGELLHLSWQQKKQFAPGVSNPHVDECYVIARKNGALGGKLTGAGGGGFLMLYADTRFHSKVTNALEGRGLRRMDFSFEQGGAKVLMNASLSLTPLEECTA
jgi:D-glycero-alpha-D-manno-heptose-7-phosphate kinase